MFLTLLKKKINFAFDIIFCDPPFASNDIENLVKLIYTNKLLAKNGVLIIHRKKNSKDNLPNYFNLIDKRIYGLSKIIYGNF